MNQRLQELLQQSTEDILGVPIVNQKKFAELIVRECVKVVDETMTENQEMNIGLVMASAQIVAHFGVEE